MRRRFCFGNFLDVEFKGADLIRLQGALQVLAKHGADPFGESRRVFCCSAVRPVAELTDNLQGDSQVLLKRRLLRWPREASNARSFRGWSIIMKFKVGDLALTQNSLTPEWNNNLLVVVLAANSEHSIDGFSAPYLIMRIDGQPFGWVGNQVFKANWAWCRPDQLRKPEDGGLLEEWQVYSRPDECQIEAFNAYERAISQLGKSEGHHGNQ